MKINYNLIIPTISLLFILPMFECCNLIYYLPIPIYFILCMKNVKKRKFIRENSHIKQIFALLINLLCWTIIFSILYLFNIKLNNAILSNFLFFYLIQNTHFSSIGFICVGLKLEVVSTRDSLKILVWNFCKISVLYIVFIAKVYNISSDFLDRFLEIILLFYVINICSSFFLKNKSILMKILNINYQNPK